MSRQDPPSFEELIAEGASVSVDGWDFSWFDGRATEERPSWGYARMLASRMADSQAALDIQTGGGEVVEVDDEADLPFPTGAFDLVVSRHPTYPLWDEIARVLQPGGTYFSQQVGAGSNRELPIS